jgi:hypothetical protein
MNFLDESILPHYSKYLFAHSSDALEMFLVVQPELLVLALQVALTERGASKEMQEPLPPLSTSSSASVFTLHSRSFFLAVSNVE